MAQEFSGKWRLQLSIKNMNTQEVDELSLGFDRFRVANSKVGRDIVLDYIGHDQPPVDVTLDGTAWQVHYEENAGDLQWRDQAQFSVTTSFDPQRGLVQVLHRAPGAEGLQGADLILTCTDMSPGSRSPARPRKAMRFQVLRIGPQR